MKNSKVLKTFLIISGLLLTFIGSSILFNPVEMKTSAGIDIAGNINLLNDVRASGALFLAIAIVTIFGVFKEKLIYTSTLVSIIFFLSLGAGRAISILLDGLPVEGLLMATILEFTLGLIGLLLFFKYQNDKVSNLQF